MKPAVLVHGGSLTEEGVLDKDSRDRIDASITLIDNREAEHLVFTAGKGTIVRVTPDGFQLRMGYTDRKIGMEMSHYASKMGFPARLIRSFYIGRDTVGEVYYAKEGILRPNGWRELFGVTSSWHAPRVKYLHEFILGPEYRSVIHAVPGISDFSPRLADIVAREHESKTLFDKQFFGVTPGDSPAIEDRLFTEHLLYKNIPKSERIRYYG